MLSSGTGKMTTLCAFKGRVVGRVPPNASGSIWSYSTGHLLIRVSWKPHATPICRRSHLGLAGIEYWALALGGERGELRASAVARSGSAIVASA